MDLTITAKDKTNRMLTIDVGPPFDVEYTLGILSGMKEPEIKSSNNKHFNPYLKAFDRPEHVAYAAWAYARLGPDEFKDCVSQGLRLNAIYKKAKGKSD